MAMALLAKGRLHASKLQGKENLAESHFNALVLCANFFFF